MREQRFYRSRVLRSTVATIAVLYGHHQSESMCTPNVQQREVKVLSANAAEETMLDAIMDSGNTLYEGTCTDSVCGAEMELRVALRCRREHSRYRHNHR